MNNLISELPKEIQNIIFFNAITITPSAKLIKNLKNKINLVKKLKLNIDFKPCVKIFDSYLLNINVNIDHEYIFNMLLENYDKYENIIHLQPIYDINYNNPMDYFYIPELSGLVVYHKDKYNMFKDIWKCHIVITCYDQELIHWDKN